MMLVISGFSTFYRRVILVSSHYSKAKSKNEEFMTILPFILVLFIINCYRR